MKLISEYNRLARTHFIGFGLAVGNTTEPNYILEVIRSRGSSEFIEGIAVACLTWARSNIGDT